MASNTPIDASKVSANAQTAPIGATGDDASAFVTKTSTGPDALDSQPSHDREQGQPGSGKATSHASEFKGDMPPGMQDTSAPEDSVEALAADTASYNKGNSKFLSSLEDAKEKQEESGSLAI